MLAKDFNDDADELHDIMKRRNMMLKIVSGFIGVGLVGSCCVLPIIQAVVVV